LPHAALAVSPSPSRWERGPGGEGLPLRRRRVIARQAIQLEGALRPCLRVRLDQVQRFQYQRPRQPAGQRGGQLLPPVQATPVVAELEDLGTAMGIPQPGAAVAAGPQRQRRASSSAQAGPHPVQSSTRRSGTRPKSERLRDSRIAP
jgi:hypothetical protein